MGYERLHVTATCKCVLTCTQREKFVCEQPAVAVALVKLCES